MITEYISHATSSFTSGDSMEHTSTLGVKNVNQFLQSRTMNLKDNSSASATNNNVNTAPLKNFWKWHKPQYWSDNEWKIFSSDSRYPEFFHSYHGMTVTDAMRKNVTISPTKYGNQQSTIPQHFTPIAQDSPSHGPRNKIAAAIHEAENILSETKEDMSLDSTESNAIDIDDNVSLQQNQSFDPSFSQQDKPSRKQVRSTFNMISKFFTSVDWTHLLETPARISQATKSYKSRFKNNCQKIYREFQTNVKTTAKTELDDAIIQLQKEIQDHKQSFEQYCTSLHEKHKSELELLTTTLKNEMQQELTAQIKKHKEDLEQFTHDHQNHTVLQLPLLHLPNPSSHPLHFLKVIQDSVVAPSNMLLLILREGHI